MKRTLFNLGLMSLFLLTTAMQCDDDEFYPTNCDEQIQNLLLLKTNIAAIANASICNEEFECRYIAFGSKPCGGPWEFLIYTTSIDTLTLTSLVEAYNQLESEYNINCNAISDCSAPQPPTGFECENNQCIPIFL
jgi:hypothetical protein